MPNLNQDAIDAAEKRIGEALTKMDARALASAFVDLSRAAIFTDAVHAIEDHLTFFAYNYKPKAADAAE
jgi:hypothetical protein